jgi:transcriptional regulator with XRE-family HTH domain
MRFLGRELQADIEAAALRAEDSCAHQVIAGRMREMRKARGWSADRLARELTTRTGVKWARMVVTKLENGRRQTVSVEELLALALVFRVAPVELLPSLLVQRGETE